MQVNGHSNVIVIIRSQLDLPYPWKFLRKNWCILKAFFEFILSGICPSDQIPTWDFKSDDELSVIHSDGKHCLKFLICGCIKQLFAIFVSFYIKVNINQKIICCRWIFDFIFSGICPSDQISSWDFESNGGWPVTHSDRETAWGTSTSGDNLFLQKSINHLSYIALNSYVHILKKSLAK